ncbi:MAG TPA: FkbM family methyltransferase [Blastocatellia bacterium]|nr:FkbM family methyltransferase [Blastocatellia bacterium]
MLKRFRTLRHRLLSLWPFPVRVRLQGVTVYVDLRSVVGRTILRNKPFDPHLTACLSQELAPGSVFIDVGANVGYFSIMALRRVGSTGEVHAFEPHPRSVRCLTLTQRANPWRNFVIHGLAAGERAGIMGLVEMWEPGHSYLNASDAGTYPCPVVPLDSWAEYYARRGLNLMKVDVEGAELNVLRGARELLTICRPVVVCEVIEANLSRFATCGAELIEYMAELDYRPEEIEGSWDRNLKFVPASRC